MKKIISAILSLFILVPSLSGCTLGNSNLNIEDTSYTITINDVSNGSVSIIDSKESYEEGDLINIVVTSDSGYRLLENSLKYNDTVIENLFFNMPASDVFISSEFELIPSPIEQIYVYYSLTTQREENEISTYTFTDIIFSMNSFVVNNDSGISGVSNLTLENFNMSENQIKDLDAVSFIYLIDGSASVNFYFSFGSDAIVEFSDGRSDMDLGNSAYMGDKSYTVSYRDINKTILVPLVTNIGGYTGLYLSIEVHSFN